MTASIPASGALLCTGDCALAADKAEALHALAQAVAADDLDAAIALGLLDGMPALAPVDHGASASIGSARTPCAACVDNARRVNDARDARVRALAARERHRARQARLRRRAEARASRRAVAAPTASDGVAAAHAAAVADNAPAMPAATPEATAPAGRPALPPAAAAALARAKARAAARGAKE